MVAPSAIGRGGRPEGFPSEKARRVSTLAEIFAAEERPTIPALRPLVDAACARDGCSHAALAARAGITPPYLSRVLTGSVDPTTRTLVRILIACGVRLVVEAADGAAPSVHGCGTMPHEQESGEAASRVES